MTQYDPDGPGREALRATTDIITSALAANRMSLDEVETRFAKLYAISLACLSGSAGPTADDKPEPRTAAQIRASITPDHIISFEDGKRYKSMKRHLTTRGLTPEAYRVKWGLSNEYPMVAANYAQQRSALAKSIGLGRSGKSPETPTA